MATSNSTPIYTTLTDATSKTGRSDVQTILVARVARIGIISPMDRRRFLTVAGGLLAIPRLAGAWSAGAPLRRLKLVNAHNGETFDGPFRDDLCPLALALAELADFLRDHHSGEKTAI